MRDAGNHIPYWIDQLNNIADKYREHDFSLSVYENDSVDDTVWRLEQAAFYGFVSTEYKSEVLGLPKFGSTKEPERVQGLAMARNKAVMQSRVYDQVDAVMAVEADCRFDVDDIGYLFEYWDETDIVSGWTAQPGTNYLYDAWATRKRNLREYDSDNNSLHSTHGSVTREQYASTFNGVCLYRADVFRQVGGYGWQSPIDGEPDCDTAVICQKFIEAGHDRIWIDSRLRVEHQ